jgi:hypothetical protein
MKRQRVTENKSEGNYKRKGSIRNTSLIENENPTISEVNEW